jgi:hypothetical protein
MGLFVSKAKHHASPEKSLCYLRNINSAQNMIFCACLHFGRECRLEPMNSGNVNAVIQAQNDPFAAFTRKKWETIVHACQRDGQDHYRAAAAALFNVLYENVTPEQREFAKRRTFAFRFSAGVLLDERE